MDIYKIPKFLVSRPKTRIICTIGPASSKKEDIEKMILSGMSVARLNLSHGDVRFHKMCINNILEISKTIDVPIGILADIPGPKFRIGKIDNNGIKLTEGNHLNITSVIKTKKLPKTIPIWPPGIEKEIAVGSELLLDDGAIRVKIISVKDKNIKCLVETSGILKSNKSLV